jgi:penicillin-binding protein 2
LSHILGFLSYPKKDRSGNYFTKEYTGKAGIEKYYNSYLNGVLGKKILKIDAQRNIISKNSIIEAEGGKNLILTIDYNLQKNLNDSLKEYIEEGNYIGGSGIIMNSETGEILASVSLPEYDSNIMTDAKDKKKIKEYLTDKKNIFLNRTFLGGYTPGSIVKPFVGLIALENNVIKS